MLAMLGWTSVRVYSILPCKTHLPCIFSLGHTFWKVQVKRFTASSANLASKISGTGDGRPRRIISTLHPHRLTPADFFDISKIQAPSYLFVTHPGRVQIINRSERKRRSYPTQRIPFPDNSRGFLYYHIPDEKYFFAGEIRFRITETGDPSNFPEGSDLLRPQGLSWNVPLHSIVTGRTQRPFRQQLLNDGLVTESQLEACANIFSGVPMQSNSIILYRLGQLFPIFFNYTYTSFFTVGRDSQGGLALRHTSIPYLLYDFFMTGGSTERVGFPYSGSALARFELSTLPEHTGTRTLVIRIIKMIEPIKHLIPGYDEYLPEPVEGALLTRRAWTSIRVWSCDVDKDGMINTALRLLLSPSATH